MTATWTAGGRPPPASNPPSRPYRRLHDRSPLAWPSIAVDATRGITRQDDTYRETKLTSGFRGRRTRGLVVYTKRTRTFKNRANRLETLTGRARARQHLSPIHTQRAPQFCGVLPARPRGYRPPAASRSRRPPCSSVSSAAIAPKPSFLSFGFCFFGGRTRCVGLNCTKATSQF